MDLLLPHLDSSVGRLRAVSTRSWCGRLLLLGAQGLLWIRARVAPPGDMSPSESVPSYRQDLVSPADDGRLRINVGSGNHPCPGWVNIDISPKHQPDVVASVYALPFRRGTFVQAYLGHVLEHLAWDLLPAAVKEVIRVCIPGARVMAVGPDIDRAVATGQPHWLLAQILDDWGKKNYMPGERHAWTPNEVRTVEALCRGGLTDVTPVAVAEVMAPDWPNPATDPWQCAVSARTPR